jgi:hypothetical protein
MLSFYLGTGRPPQYQMQIAERLIVADKTRLIHHAAATDSRRLLQRTASAYSACYLDGTAASLPIMPWVMHMVAQWSIRVTRWWTMLTANRLSVTLTQRHAQNAAGRGG